MEKQKSHRCPNHPNLKIQIRPIHGKLQKKRILASKMLKPQLHTMSQKRQRYMATLAINVRTPLPQRPTNSQTQPCNTPHHSNTTSQQTHPILHTNKRRQPQQHEPTTYCPGLTPKMHMPTNQMPMSSHAQTNILCILEVPNHTTPPILQSHPHTIQFIEFTYCHDIFPEQALMQKHTKYDPLINTLQNQGWKTNPLITITVGVRGAIHEQSINHLTNLKIPKTSIKIFMKNIHQNAIKYLTYLVLNKRKFENKQTTIPPP